MKNFKKTLSLFLALIMIMGTVGVVSADHNFADLSTAHWGYSYVQTLVADGTINGYADGTFRPEANVTRAEFVKMIGKTDKAFETPFADIAGHWAYDYIMYSDMDVEGTNFKPDVAITRQDVVNLLWKRAGSPAANAPSIITNQSNNKGAIAWAYAYGIMNGDDGVTLRLEDGVTRAEAAALICRSRTIDYSNVKSFADTVDQRLLKEVYDSLVIFGEYQPDRAITYGELAHMAMTILYDDFTPSYDGVGGYDITINRTYGLSFSATCNAIWGQEYKTEEVYEKNATVLDAVAALTFAVSNKSYTPIIDGTKDDFYADVTSVSNDVMNECISSAHKIGIRLDNSDNIYPESTLNAKKLALILLQLDAVGGTSTYYLNSIGVSFPLDAHIKKEINKYPSNPDRFPMILEEVPTEVYNSPFIDVDGTVCKNSPMQTYSLSRGFTDLFLFSIDNFTYTLLDNGARVVIDFYPSLICESENGFIFKTKILVDNHMEGVTFDDVFPNTLTEKPQLKPRLTFFATIAVGSNVDGNNIPFDKAKITSIDYIY